ncbi:MAG: cob(I)yrinic acid a,c-diamide adenosyltransferase [Candidatus Marinimicrobia bacterium]|nr:cob(I)yrinic acid a,c-diamide adenosyltransferase [Candidatus Neomarinimicrobiota bacterium]
MRITKVITKKGDKGMTSLGEGSNVSKSDLRIETLGDLDELNAVLGVAIISCEDNNVHKELTDIQNDLLNLGGEVAVPNIGNILIKEDRINILENKTETLNKTLPPLKDFILPGGDELSSRLHVARAVCRRAERSVVRLAESDDGDLRWIRYLNRLSDFLFVLARSKNSQSEEIWDKTEK